MFRKEERSSIPEKNEIEGTCGSLSILHFNDVYNIDANTAIEPIGGAARFCTAIKSFQPLNPLVLFSGDAFSPSMRKNKHIKYFNHINLGVFDKI